MSLTLKRLRETFGDELVRYERKRTVYSALAEEIRPRVADVLERSWSLVELTRRFDPQSFRGNITICAPQSTLMFIYGPLVAALAVSAAGLSIRAIPYRTALETTGRADLSILPEWLADPALSQRPLFTEAFSCLIPPNRTFGSRMDEAAYLSHQHAALPFGEEELFWPERSEARDLLAQRNVGARASQIEALRFLVVHNALIATVPSRIAHQNGALSTAHPMNAPRALSPVSMVMQLSNNRAGEPALRWLMDELARLISTYDLPEPAAFPDENHSAASPFAKLMPT